MRARRGVTSDAPSESSVAGRHAEFVALGVRQDSPVETHDLVVLDAAAAELEYPGDRDLAVLGTEVEVYPVAAGGRIGHLLERQCWRAFRGRFEPHESGEAPGLPGVEQLGPEADEKVDVGAVEDDRTERGRGSNQRSPKSLCIRLGVGPV